MKKMKMVSAKNYDLSFAKEWTASIYRNHNRSFGRANVELMSEVPHFLIGVDAWVREVIETQEIIFITPIALSSIRAKRLRRDFVSYSKVNREFVKSTYPCHTFSPYVRLFIDLMDKYFYEPVNLSPHTVHTFNGFVATIRSIVKQEKLREVDKNFQKLHLKNSKGIIEYVDRIFFDYKRLIVLKFDLNLQPFYSSRPTLEAEENLIHNAHNSFFKDLKRIIPSLLGYCWKLEYSPFKGYHYNVFLFLNYRHLFQKLSFESDISRRWASATGDQGEVEQLHFSLRPAQMDRTVQLRIVSNGDKKAMAELKNSLLFSTHIEKYVRVKLTKNRRAFRHGLYTSPSEREVGFQDEFNDRFETLLELTRVKLLPKN